MERRADVRADASLSMRLEGRPEEGELTKIVTESRNISASGVYCSSPHYLAPLSKVALTIVLPNHTNNSGTQRLLKCEGVVVRCRQRESGPKGYDLACSFLTLDPRHRTLLEEFVSLRNLHTLTGRAVAPAPAARKTAARSAPKRRKAPPRNAARSKASPGRSAARKTTARAARPARPSAR